VSLSDSRVISLLNGSFVPVYLANEDYRDKGAAPPEEKKDLRRIHAEGHAAGKSVGTVHAYVLDSEGKLLDSMHVAEAAKANGMLGMLQRTVEKLGVKPGAPVAAAKPQSQPAAKPGELTVHVVARYLEKKGNEYVLIEDAGGNWSAFPGESWVSLSPAQQAKLVPAGPADLGAKWTPDPEVVKTLLGHFYPPTENNDLSKNRFEAVTLQGSVLTKGEGRTVGVLSGSFRMGHPFYHKEDGRVVEAALGGRVIWETATGKVSLLRLVTQDGIYRSPQGQGLPFGVAARSIP